MLGSKWEKLVQDDDAYLKRASRKAAPALIAGLILFGLLAYSLR